MKIKTITCHDVYNYGASLQAFALQNFLEQVGHEVQIIDYLPNKKRRRYEYKKLATTGFLHNIALYFPFLTIPMALWQNRWELLSLGRKVNFDSFKKKFLHCTYIQYSSYEELKERKPIADMFIAGSDQIWNVSYENGKDPAFYCAFESNKNKCISYAASFGSDKIEIGYEDYVKQSLLHLKSISVREYSGINILKSLGLNGTQVLDPVFLLSQDMWRLMCGEKKMSNYILIYDFLHNDYNIKKLSLLLSKKYQKKIISINDFKPLSYADVNVNNAGPIEFLEYVSNADMVISSSFHATAFSVIFGKQFYTFPLLGHGNSSRMRDFLNMISLDKRFIDSFDKFDSTDIIDYDKVNLIIKEEQIKSKHWLLSQLSN